jgi:hypothetical protein
MKIQKEERKEEGEERGREREKTGFKYLGLAGNWWLVERGT